jgi:hypothetical protein
VQCNAKKCMNNANNKYIFNVKTLSIFITTKIELGTQENVSQK